MHVLSFHPFVDLVHVLVLDILLIIILGMQRTAKYAGRVLSSSPAMQLQWAVWDCPSTLRREFRDVFPGPPQPSFLIFSSSYLMPSELSSVSLEDLSDLLIIQCFQKTVLLRSLLSSSSLLTFDRRIK